MAPPAFRDGAPAVVVELTEWEQIGPAQDPQLAGLSLAGNVSAQRITEALRGRVDIREGYKGLEIGSSSFVGRIDVGPLRIAIRPKLPALPLARLLRYAYGLRDLGTLDETRSPTARHGLHDLLVALLAAEIEELLHRGLARRYIPRLETLESPRGQIRMQELVRQGGVKEARLPCRHVERRADWQLNQVLRAGFDMAGRLTGDAGLRRRVQQLSAGFGEVARRTELGARDIDQAEQGLTRLTAASAPALTIIRLLLDAQGLTFEPEAPSSRMPGFLFDMNVFFQRLLSRFLHDHLADQRIVDERAIRGIFAYAPDANPRRRSVPQPRPDYALLKGNTLLSFLDAKYRDVWDRGLPAEWLYQLAIYALASPSQVSVLLYASMAATACDERLDVRQPLPRSDKISASVILRPVPLPRLAELLDPEKASSSMAERRRLANQLVSFRVVRTATVTRFPAVLKQNG